MLDTIRGARMQDQSIVREGEFVNDLGEAIFGPKELFAWRKRKLKSHLFAAFCALSVAIAASLLVWLVASVALDGAEWLSWDFLQNFPSRKPEKAGIHSAVVGSIWLLGLTAAIAIPLGVGSAIFLQELMPRNFIRRSIEFNLLNLASVPSIVFGILGLAVFVRFLFLGRSLIAGALTLSILILPVIVITTMEALQAVPDTLRHAAFAVGATKWQTARHHVLPAASPGILTGIILAISRAIGETAPLIMIGALLFVAFVPEGPMDGFTALPIQIFNWASRPQEEFHGLAAAGILVLLAILLTANATAIILRQRSRKKGLWQLL